MGFIDKTTYFLDPPSLLVFGCHYKAKQKNQLELPNRKSILLFQFHQLNWAICHHTITFFVLKIMLYL